MLFVVPQLVTCKDIKSKCTGACRISDIDVLLTPPQCMSGSCGLVLVLNLSHRLTFSNSRRALDIHLSIYIQCFEGFYGSSNAPRVFAALQ